MSSSEALIRIGSFAMKAKWEMSLPEWGVVNSAIILRAFRSQRTIEPTSRLVEAIKLKPRLESERNEIELTEPSLCEKVNKISS